MVEKQGLEQENRGMEMSNRFSGEGWLFGVKAIAGFLGVSERTVKRWCQGQEPGFPSVRVGGRWGAHEDDLRKWTGRRAA